VTERFNSIFLQSSGIKLLFLTHTLSNYKTASLQQLQLEVINTASMQQLTRLVRTFFEMVTISKPQAALEAFICVIECVKTRSGRTDLDGDNLMNQAFGSENRVPILKFNALQTDAEKDEQKGIMFLFKGVVGLRNAKSHSNTLFNSPQRAHEYLASASLLMRLLEIATNA
jgi:uncharacterized protein (TIGR02391 family)